MFGAKSMLLVLALAAVGLAFFLYTPIPDGYSTATSLKMRGLFAALDLIRFLSVTGERVGYAPWYVSTRQLHKLIAFFNDDVEGVQVRDEMFGLIPVRIYEPEGRKGLLPGLVYYHGGGFVWGGVELYDALIRQLSLETNTVALYIEYRRAPEVPFPAAHEDCVTATKHFLRHASDYNVDPARVAIAGDSAGGNLAATVALRLREESFTPAVKLQVLIYPTVQLLHTQLPSMLQNADGPVITRADLPLHMFTYLNISFDHFEAFMNNDHLSAAAKAKYYSTYLNVDNLPAKYLKRYEKQSLSGGDEKMWNAVKKRILDPRFSPLVAEDLGRLPAAFMLSCEHNVLRDDDFLYAHRLRAAGVKVEHFNHDIGFHGEFTFAVEWPETQEAIGKIVAFVKKNL